MSLGGLPQDEIMVRGQIEYAKEKQQLLPVYKPGDRYIITGALVGVIAGIVIGVKTGMPWVFIVGLIGGGIIGTLLGSAIGALVTKYRGSRNNLRYY